MNVQHRFVRAAKVVHYIVIPASFLGLSIIGALIGLRLLDPTRQTVGPVNTEWEVNVDVGGGTRLDVPIADFYVTFPTHLGLFNLEGSVEGINHQATTRVFNELESIKSLGREIDAATDRIGPDTRAGIRSVILRSVLAMLTGSFALALLVWRKLKKALLSAGLIASLLVGSLVVALITRDEQALSKYQYHGGAVEEGLALLGDIGLQYDRLNSADEQITKIVASIAEIYHATTLIQTAPEEPVIKVLLASDIHDWPPSFELMQAVIGDGNISFVIDAGDITKYGTTIESAILEDIRKLKVPYVFVGGNHDSKQTAHQLDRLPNVVVLKSQPIDIEGLRVLGSSDPRQPRFHGSDPSELVEEQGLQLAAIAAEDGAVDVAVVHNPIAGRQLFGTVPLVLAGHLHNRLIENHFGTMMYVEGSTSGAVLDFVETAKDPLSRQMSILEFDPVTHRLIAYTRIDIPPLISTNPASTTDVSIVRTLVDKE